MGRILTFAPRILRQEPPTTANLRPAESILLLALRWWVADLRQGGDPTGRLRHALAMAALPAPAADAVDGFMRSVARGARRQIEIHAPRCPCLAADEAQFLRAARLAQIGEAAATAGCLSEDMLAPEAAALAAGALAGLGQIFAVSGLRFSASPPIPTAPEPEAAEDSKTEGWRLPPWTVLH
ncbi:hypothetical protein JYK14_16740 [Siccirubricoccus sp. KC 17139]|uniref:Uncharacterized protein n=1 Tax=Siccirubricoccus soli TaxID=2899147 RepID=A0ABT1D862_9PROT|nr:hypothetical protein [Siccirubricoccus soli]MCO6417797.1 hypothetical protein [Siccirubricoccus soli]MCP2683932.1 hypothetical protein [Siccirubricoccus soli]